jgi:hypothetical protein
MMAMSDRSSRLVTVGFFYGWKLLEFFMQFLVHICFLTNVTLPKSLIQMLHY